MRLFVADLLLALALTFAVLGWLGASYGPAPTLVGWGLGGAGLALWPSRRRAVFVVGVVTFLIYVGMAIIVALALRETWERVAAAMSRPPS